MAGDPERALDLYQAGKPMLHVAKHSGYAGVAAATKAVKGLLLKRGVVADPELIRLAAMDRLDRLIKAAWDAATDGNLDAIKVAADIEERRLRLLALTQTAAKGPIAEAVELTLAGLVLEPSDEAAIALLRRLATQLDASATVLDPTVQTKASYMTPHVMNILRELGATPAARAAIKNAKGGESGKSAKLTALRGGKAPATGT